MKKALLLLLAVSLNGVASEVGAPIPQLEKTADSLQIAIADTGASNRWVTQPHDKKASTSETREFEMRAEGLSVKLNQELDAAISRKLDSLLATYDELL